MKKKRKEKRRVYIGFDKKLEIIKLSILFFVLLVSCLLTYYFFFYERACLDKECFQKALVECKKAKWKNDMADATWLYTIKGPYKGKCEIEVKLLLAKEGKSDITEAEGKKMSCFLPLSIIENPEQDLNKCNGELKEELQGLMIKRMHSYILENLGEIGEELIQPI